MGISGKKIAILLAEQYEDLEFWYPYYRMKEEGVQVTVIAAKAKQQYPSKHGYPAKSDLAAADANVDDFDCVIIPGGFGPDFMRRDDSMVDFVNQAVKANVLIAAICHGVWMLCCTDVLKGKRATSFFSIRFDVENAGAKWVNSECVVDGNIITSRNPDDLPAFCKAISSSLATAMAGAGAR